MISHCGFVNSVEGGEQAEASRGEKPPPLSSPPSFSGDLHLQEKREKKRWEGIL